MANRTEPYRDYSEHEVINLFSLAVAEDETLSSWKAGATGGKFDAGVVVAAVQDAAALPGDLPGFVNKDAAGTGTHALRKYLGASGQPHVGYNAYPVNEMNIAPAVSGGLAPLGITLKQTLAYDENDENLLRYPLKADELQAVLPGQATPILTRGLILLNEDAFENGAAMDKTAVGSGLAVSTTDGLFVADAAGTLGKIIAHSTSTDAGKKKFLCKVSF